MTDAIPKFLFITANITKIDPQNPMGIGGFGSVFKGNYAGQLVALKVLTKARHEAVSQISSPTPWH